MKIQPSFTFDRVAFDKDTETHLVVSLIAPSIDWQKRRQQVCVIPCIDISGSMGGQKLYYAKQAALKLVDQLSPTDYAGLVTFSTNGRVDFPPVQMTPENKDRLREVLGKMHVEGGTNFSDGMLKALDVAQKMDLPSSVLTRVIMLTDGQPTHGIAQDASSLSLLLAKERGHVSLSAFGFGSDPDQTLLSRLSETGEGNYAFIDDPDKALSAFGKELGGLLSTYAQSVVIEVTPSNGHILSDVLSDVDAEKEVTGEWTVKVPSLLAEETFNLVFAARLSAQKQPGPRQVNTVSVKVSYERLGEDGALVRETIETKAKAQFVKADEAQKGPHKEADVLVARAQLVKAQLEAEKAVSRGDYQAANAAFNVAAQSFQARGLGNLSAMTSTIGGLYADPSSYNSTMGRRTALRSATSRGAGTSGMSGEDASLLASTGYVVTNSAQDEMMSAFSGAPVPPAISPDLGFPFHPPVIITGNAGGPQPTPQLPTASEIQARITKNRSKRW